MFLSLSAQLDGRASSDPRISNPERFTVTRRDHPHSLRRWHRAIHFHQAFGWVIRPAVDTATISCLGGRRRSGAAAMARMLAVAITARTMVAREIIPVFLKSRRVRTFGRTTTFQRLPNPPPPGDPAGPVQRRRISQRSRARRPDRPSHLCSVASYQSLHLAPVNRATLVLVRLPAITAREGGPQRRRRSGSGIQRHDQPSRPLGDGIIPARHRAKSCPVTGRGRGRFDDRSRVGRSSTQRGRGAVLRSEGTPYYPEM